jgi:predicted metal-dependent hydrolase
MISELKLAEITVEITEKEIKNIHLSVNPPDGKVRISVPNGTSVEAVRMFALSKLSWIRKEQKKMSDQPREAPREFLNRESHYVWGERYLLKIVELETASTVELRNDFLVVTVRQGTTPEKVGEIVEHWLRDLVRSEAARFIQKWEPILGVKVRSLFVQKMKTQWGACNAESSSVRINTDLARKPLEFLEYVVVHEMVHLIEPSHGARFQSLMDQFFPNWRQFRAELNSLPVRDLEWR